MTVKNWSPTEILVVSFVATIIFGNIFAFMAELVMSIVGIVKKAFGK